MADDVLKIFAEGRVDAQSLSGFMEQPSDALVPRRLAPPINTLNYFLDYLRALELVYSQQTGVVNVNGVQVKAITQAIKDALNSAAIDNNTQVDTLITATPQYIDGVAVTQAQVNAETVSVERFGVTSSSVDNTLKMRKAFAYCKANNCTLYFPPKNYSCTSTIYSFHDVEISGKGSIQRGSDIYYVEPNSKQINTIYISSNGNGDGLSSSTATSLTFLPQVLKNIGKRSLSGGWKIKILSGNYTNTGLRFDDVPSFNQRLIIEGEKDFTGTVTAIWNGVASTEAYAIRADLVCSPLRALFKDIRFEYWEKSTSNAGGIVAWGGHDIITENCYFKNTPIGVWTSRNSQHRSRGDTFDTCVTWGIGCQYSSSVVVGLPTARTKFKNCGKGLHVGRASIGHNDYADFEDNDYDLYVTQNSRITHLNPTFKRWKFASHYIQNGAINESIDVCDFDAASITYATPILFTENAAVIDKVQSKGMELLHQSYVPLFSAKATGLTEPKELGTLTGFGSWCRLPKMLFYQGSTISMRVVMRLQGINAGATNSLSFSAASNSDTREFVRVTLPTGGWNGMLELNFEFRDGGGCYAYGKLTTNNVTYFVSKTLTNAELEAGFIDKTSDLTLWRSYVRLAQTTDELTVISMKSWVTL